MSRAVLLARAVLSSMLLISATGPAHAAVFSEFVGDPGKE